MIAPKKAAAAAFFFGGGRYNIRMPELRHWFVVVLAVACLLTLRVASAAGVADDLEAMRSIAQAGAPRLVLRRINALQPTDTAAPRWAEWERLRVQLLADTGGNEELLQRAAAWPAGLPTEMSIALHTAAAQAALALGRNVEARNHAGRALWVPGAESAQIRELRRLVIRSYVRDGRDAGADDAYRSMLRFQQDYRPLDGATATAFVHDLLDIGQAKEAVTWLGLLEERGTAKLRLRLHTGLIAPREVVTQARTGLARSEDPQWWRILLEAADRAPDAALRLEALEQLLNEKDGTAADARKLWDAYVDYARAAANSHQLLAGDDLNWLEFATRQRVEKPVIARAYFAYLFRHARAAPERQRAQTQLAESFAAAKLARTALRVFAVWPADMAELAASTRYVLGMLAETAAEPGRAWLCWQGLPAPDGMVGVWDLRLAALALRAGHTSAAADLARQLAGGRSAIASAQRPEWMALAQQYADYGLTEGAQVLFERVLPQVDAAQARFVLSALAHLHEVNQPLLAADYYLRAAVRASGPDAAAAEARLQAGFSLARAGLHEDARVQFEWLLKNARDPAQIAAARRALGF